jgi:nucleotide-binding universal stress UspA family protein
MLTIKKILCPTDFSDASLKGLEYAIDLATLFQAEIKVLYVLPIIPPAPNDPNVSFEVPEFERLVHKDSEQKLQAIVEAKIPKTLKAAAVIGHGSPAKEIVRVAEDEKMDLIVIATHGHSGWHHLVLGSVAEKVIRMAHCPVFAYRDFRK